MGFTVLSVGSPFTAVGPDAVGGAEQLLSQLDASLEMHGHRSFVVACKGSWALGKIIYTPRYTGTLDKQVQDARETHRAAIAEALEKFPIDLVHFHTSDFAELLPDGEVPVLVTLRRPAHEYAKPVWPIERPFVYLHCVAASQRHTFDPEIPFLPDIHDGVPYSELQSPLRKRNYALALGRVATEKAFHIAMDAAARADVPLLLAGELLGFTAHEEYFETQIAPRLDAWRRFLGPVTFARKRRLLTSAQCLLIASQAPETGAIAAREALACGTPVIAFPFGALPEIIEHGRTGYLVQDEREMAAAIRRAGQLSSEMCRTTARERFPVARTIQDYFAQYERVLARPDLGT